jgi:hypothetical protein
LVFAPKAADACLRSPISPLERTSVVSSIDFQPAPHRDNRRANACNVPVIVARPIVATSLVCLSADDMGSLVNKCSSLPGSGLRQLGSSSRDGCDHDAGTEMYGHDRDGPFWLHIRWDGYVTAANGRGELHWHAAAVAEELRWHDRLRYRVLHSALRPAGSMLVDLARLAEVASSVPGCTVKFEARPVPNTLQLVFARYGAKAGKVVVDISTAGHMRARIRRRNRDGGLGRFSGSKPKVAEKVLAQLLVTQAAWSADAADFAHDFGANYLFTSSVLT